MLIMRSRTPAAEPERIAYPEPTPPPLAHEAPAPAADPAYSEQMRAWRASLVEQVGARLADSEAIRTGMQVDEATRRRVRALVRKRTVRTRLSLDETTTAALLGQVIDEFCGFGPIQSLLDDASVSEIMVNGPLHVYVERKGKSVLTQVASTTMLMSGA